MAIVDDNGNEVLRKAADRKTSTKYRVRTLDTPIETNRIVLKRTQMSTAAKKIDFPDEGNEFLIYHADASNSVWLGENANVSAAGANAVPLLPGMRWPVYVAAGNDVALYGITSSATFYVYVLGMIKEA